MQHRVIDDFIAAPRQRRRRFSPALAFLSRRRCLHGVGAIPRRRCLPPGVRVTFPAMKSGVDIVCRRPTSFSGHRLPALRLLAAIVSQRPTLGRPSSLHCVLRCVPATFVSCGHCLPAADASSRDVSWKPFSRHFALHPDFLNTVWDINAPPTAQPCSREDDANDTALWRLYSKIDK